MYYTNKKVETEKLLIASKVSVLWEHPFLREFLVVFESEALGESTGGVLIGFSGVADELASVHLLKLSDLSAVPFALGRLVNLTNVGDEPAGVAGIGDAVIEAEGAEIGLDEVGGVASFFEFDVDVDSSISGVEGVLEVDSPDLVALVVAVLLDDVVAGTSDLDEGDVVVESEEDVVTVVPGVTDGTDGVKVDFNTDVEAILASPCVGSEFN
jgi:hypothetical protein